VAGPTLTATLQAKLDAFTQQMTQAGDIAEQAVKKIEDTFSNANPQFGGDFLKTALGGIAGGGALAAFVALLQSANKEMAELHDNAKLVSLSIEDFQKFQFAANVGGLSNKDFASGVTAMATKLNDAVRSENDLTKLLDANNVTYKDDNDKLITTNQLFTIAANLVHNARTELDKVKIADMLGLTKEWVPVLEQGGAAFNNLANKAIDAGAVIDTETINKAKLFETQWNQSTARWSAMFKAETGEIAGYLNTLIDKAGQFVAAAMPKQAQSGGAQFGGQTQQDHNNDTITLLVALAKAYFDVKLNAEELEAIQNRAALRGEGVPQVVLDKLDALKTKSDAAKKSMQELAAQTFGDNVPLPRARPAAADANGDPTNIPGAADESNKALDREVARLDRHIATLDADTVAVGLNAGEHEKLRTELILLNAASQDDEAITTAKIDQYTKLRATMSAQQALDAAGIELDKKHSAAFAEVPPRAAEAGLAAAKAKQEFAGLNSALTFAGDQAISIVDGLRTHSLTAAQAVQQLTNQIITALEKAVLLGQGPLAAFLGLAGQPGSGGLGGILGMLTTKGGSAGSAGGMGGEIPAFASGTDSAPGGPAWVGESGPELINLPKGASVTPMSALQSMAGGGGGGGGPINVSLNVVNNAGAEVNMGSPQPNGNGGFDLTVLIDKAVATKASQPGSQINRALGGYGISQQPVRR
jgi:hypothetical protein